APPCRAARVQARTIAAVRPRRPRAVQRGELSAHQRTSRRADLRADAMTETLAFAAYLVLPLIGIGVWRLDAVRRLDLPARIAVALAAGTLITGAVMALMSIVHVGWSRTTLVVVLGA